MLHALLAVWAARANSVTFDENFHVPAGVRIVRAADFATSWAQPPLPKTVYALAALAAGAREPDPALASPGGERYVGYSFMRVNADRYARVYFAARLVAVLLSTLLGVMVWRAARAFGGPLAGVIALALWCVLPETIAHAAVAGVDLPTGLVFFGATLAWYAFVRSGSWRRWLPVAGWTAAAVLTRFSAVQLFPIFALIALAARGRTRRPLRVWSGLALLGVVAPLAIVAGYAFQVSLRPLAAFEFHSAALLAAQHALPALRLPLPDAWLGGVDYLGYLSQPGIKSSFLLGKVTTQHTWWYFPVAIAVKWPLGLLALIAWRAVHGARVPGGSRRRLREWTLLAPVAVVLLSSMAANLDYGVRYLYPVLPFLCVWVSGLIAARGGTAAAARRAAIVLALVAAVGIECARGLPYPLAFFNAFAGGPGRGDRIVNDSNVDWGQGLVALHRDLRRLGVQRVLLAYHGTTDPALYGIDYDLYLGDEPGVQGRWLAVSSYFSAGLPARLTTGRGMSEEAVRFDLSALRTLTPVARPGNCMYLYRLP